MDAKTFALVALLGVPFALIALLVLVHRLTPAALWRTAPFQIFGTVGFLGALAAPYLIYLKDAQGNYFEDHQQLVSRAFALPADTVVNKQRDRTVRLGDCWRNAVNWRSEVEFPTANMFDDWYAREHWKKAIVSQIAGYYGVEPASIAVSEGALDMRSHDPKYQLSEEYGSYEQNVRILEFNEPFVCAAIEKGEDGRIALRACDPVSLKRDTGNAGEVIINPSLKDRTLEGRIFYAQGPSTCTNPVRRAVNEAMGWPHPEGGEPNLSMGAILPGD